MGYRRINNHIREDVVLERLTENTIKYLKGATRYKGFTLLEDPVRFNDLFAGKEYEKVQLFCTDTIENDGDVVGICGFCGICSWKNGKITPLDGDSYNSEMAVYGYEEWGNGEKGIDVLVGTDW